MFQKISPKDIESLDNSIIIDTRTPKEFDEWNIPGAISLPILSNEERAVVGTLYSKVSKEVAIKKGEEIVFADEENLLKKYLPYKDKNMIVHCWRGGMRSGRICKWLVQKGFKHVYQLENGIKAYRAMVLEELESYIFPQKLVVIWGQTGCGKTKLLLQLNNALDLEGLAQHRSSVYGAVGLKPRTQKHFEVLLLKRLKELEQYDVVYTEGESQRIGNLLIPKNIYKQMLSATHYLLKTSIKQRVAVTREEYFDGSKNNELELIRATESIEGKLGKKKVAHLLDLLAKKNYDEFIRILLEEYYDPLYGHTLEKKEYEKIIEYNDFDKLVKDFSH